MHKYFKFIKKDECKKRLEAAAVMSDILNLFGHAGKFYFNQEKSQGILKTDVFGNHAYNGHRC